MEYIRDREKVKKEIEKELKNQKEKIKYSYIEKVKIRNRFTKQEQLLKDVYFIATNNGSSKPLCICALRKGTKTYVLHDDITHWNMNCGLNCYNIDDKTSFLVRDFCNTVLMKHIWENPDHASKFLIGTLSEGNPNDRYRTPNSLQVDQKEEPALAANGQLITNKATIEQILLRRFDTSVTSRTDKLYLKEIKDKLKDKNKCYAHASYTNSFPRDYFWDVIEKDKIGKDYVISTYYKTYSYDDFNEIGEIPREEIDICCVGCGSAGSNIMEPLARTEFMSSCLLIDYDIVERKNLRNQTYTQGNVGTSKVSSLSSRIVNIRDDIISGYKRDKYENIDFEQYKFKYIISGFDSIECRLGLLELIKNKKIEAQYLIDTRYDELNSSLYFIDTNNEKELEYYEKLLKADNEEFKNKKEENKISTLWTTEEAEVWARENAICGSCRSAATKIGLENSEFLRICDHIGENTSCSCGSSTCIEQIRKALEQQKVEHEIDENSCQHVNIIHIYKLTSSWVLSVMRGIETDEKKPVTHVEITADPIPNAVVIKK